MTVLVVSQVRHELVKVARVSLERAAGGEMDVSDDFVHADASRHIATLGRLFVQLICPPFVFALSMRGI